MRKWLSVCTLCLLAGASGAAKLHSPLLGKWQAQPNDATFITYEFKTDGSVFWMYQQGTIWSGITAKYRINDKVQPIEIDLYEFSDPDMAGVTLKGIVAFDDAEHLRMAAARDARPSDFDTSTVSFVKTVEAGK